VVPFEDVPSHVRDQIGVGSELEELPIAQGPLLRQAELVFERLRLGAELFFAALLLAAGLLQLPQHGEYRSGIGHSGGRLLEQLSSR
jgi:hypothetical protein